MNWSPCAQQNLGDRSLIPTVRFAFRTSGEINRPTVVHTYPSLPPRVSSLLCHFQKVILSDEMENGGCRQRYGYMDPVIRAFSYLGLTTKIAKERTKENRLFFLSFLRIKGSKRGKLPEIPLNVRFFILEKYNFVVTFINIKFGGTRRENRGAKRCGIFTKVH